MHHFNDPRFGDCAGCGCFTNLNDHRCPSLFHKEPSRTIPITQDELEQINRDAEQLAREAQPTPRQLSKHWFHVLYELGVYSVPT